jgi:hypothetical protein
MNSLLKKAKLKAIMDIISDMDEMEMERIPRDMDDMEEVVEPEKKGLTIVKMEKSKPEIEIETEEKKPYGMQETEETEEEIDDPEMYDESTSLGRLMKKLKKV